MLGETKFLRKCDLIGTHENPSKRDSWVISKLSEIEKGKILLDAGAGEMKYAGYCSHLKYISQDFGGYEPDHSREGLHTKEWDYSKIMVRSDISAIPFEDESIDVVLCMEVFEHIKNPLSTLKEFVRTLVREELILTASFASLVHMTSYYYHSGFSRYWYEENLRDTGFEIVELESYGNYFSWMWQEINRLQNIGERYCKKSLNINERRTVYEMLNILNQYQSIDNCSDEMLCFGYMVVAIKR